MEVKPTRSSFRQYMSFWGGQMFSLLGSMVVHFVIIWYLTETTESALVLALASFFFILPMVVVFPIAGVFSDRLDRKKLIIMVDSLQAATTVVLILLFAIGYTNIAIIFLFIALRSVFQAFHQPTVNAVIPTMVPKEKLSRINGVNFLASGVIQLIGPALAGTLLIFISVEQALWTDVITFFIALVPLLLITIPKVKIEKEAKDESFKEEFKDGIKTLRTIPGVMSLLFMAMLINFLIQPINVLGSLFIYSNHAGNQLEYAFISMGIQTGIIAGALLTTIKKQWKNKIPITIICLIIFMIGYAFMSLAPYRAFLYIFLVNVSMGFILPIINTIFQTIMQTIIPHEKFGRVSSIDSMLSMLITPVGALIVGPLAEVMGITNIFLLSAILGVSVTIFMYLFSGLRKLDFKVITDTIPTSEVDTPPIIE
ncbi:MAG: MFS transporter [Promethearchaeota archaeon]|nr:MAG: MFS transporter [Candidatus Lokiarchaeota archaeon]